MEGPRDGQTRRWKDQEMEGPGDGWTRKWTEWTKSGGPRVEDQEMDQEMDQEIEGPRDGQTKDGGTKR